MEGESSWQLLLPRLSWDGGCCSSRQGCVCSGTGRTNSSVGKGLLTGFESKWSCVGQQQLALGGQWRTAASCRAVPDEVLYALVSPLATTFREDGTEKVTTNIFLQLVGCWNGPLLMRGKSHVQVSCRWIPATRWQRGRGPAESPHSLAMLLGGGCGCQGLSLSSCGWFDRSCWCSVPSSPWVLL